MTSQNFFSIEIEFDTFFTSKSCGLRTFRGRNVVEVDPCLRARLSGASGSLGPGLPRGEDESSPSCPAIDAHRRPPHAFHTRPRRCEPRIADFRHVRTSRPCARFTKRNLVEVDPWEHGLDDRICQSTHPHMLLERLIDDANPRCSSARGAWVRSLRRSDSVPSSPPLGGTIRAASWARVERMRRSAVCVGGGADG